MSEEAVTWMGRARSLAKHAKTARAAALAAGNLLARLNFATNYGTSDEVDKVAERDRAEMDWRTKMRLRDEAIDAALDFCADLTLTGPAAPQKVYVITASSYADRYLHSIWATAEAAEAAEKLVHDSNGIETWLVDTIAPVHRRWEFTFIDVRPRAFANDVPALPSYREQPVLVKRKRRKMQNGTIDDSSMVHASGPDEATARKTATDFLAAWKAENGDKEV